MNRAAIVANPSKLDDPAATRQVVERVCTRHGWSTPLWIDTTEEDPGGGQAREALAEGVDLVCALGGDGTVRAVAEVLAGGEVPLGLLPAGTGNLLARALELAPDDLEAAVELALTGRTARIDVGALRADGASDEHVFLVMAGMGLDAETMSGTDERLKGVLGWPAYVLSGLRAAAGRGFTAHVQPEHGTTVRRHVRAVLIGNSGRLQGGIELLPEASLDDGLLDVAVVSPRGPFGWARTIATVLTRGRGNRQLARLQGAAFRVVADRPTATQLDGDPIGVHRRLECRVRPGALLVRVAGKPT
ncbi:diacylglycerol/lipid kinase family protein [Cellulomonas soli]|uniref:diacylglycerol/lipid kinase family protein n=1 Tax=Cellulomonas soli TaxID=931535 RepID=UPI003F87A7E4